MNRGTEKSVFVSPGSRIYERLRIIEKSAMDRLGSATLGAVDALTRSLNPGP